MGDSKNRTVKLTVRVSVEEHRSLQDLAHAARLPIADFVRRASLNKAIRTAPAPVPELNRQAYVRLNSLTENFEKILPLLTTSDAIESVETNLRSVIVTAIESTQALRATLIRQQTEI